MKFKKKVLQFEAFQWFGTDGRALSEAHTFFLTGGGYEIRSTQSGSQLFVDTKKAGRREVQRTDWVLRGYLGGLHILTDAEFRAQYEPLEDEATP